MANRHPRAGGRPKIDWAAARELYASDPTLGFADIARTFSVSTVSVRKHARSGEDWDARRAEVQEAARKRLAGQLIRSIDERAADTVRVAEKLRERILEADTGDIDLVAAIRTLPRFAQLEQLFAGEATTRLDLADAQATVMTIVRILGPVVPRDLRESKLRELKAALAGLPLELDGGAA